MSSTNPQDYTERLNLAELVARIERMNDESAKLRMEAAKLQVEQLKMHAEEIKLRAEASKLDRDRNLSPWLAFGAGAGGVVTLGALLLRALGVLS